MSAFFWAMAALTVGTFVPSVCFILLYGLTGEDGCLRRARALFNWAKLFWFAWLQHRPLGSRRRGPVAHLLSVTWARAAPRLAPW